MFPVRICLAAALIVIGHTASAATFTFNADPFAGTTFLTDPGRQISPNPQTPINFDIANDILVFDQNVFGVSSIQFANDLSTNLPSSGVNFIVLQDGAPLAAGTAANAIAAQITDPGPGFFIYFNSTLDLPRLVYSTDLSDPTADLAILARFPNLSGTAGFAALPTITEANASTVPEPSTLLVTAGSLLLCGCLVRRRNRSVPS